MSVQVSADDSAVINFSPTPREEVIQNVRMILSTLQGTVPLDRGFGIDTSMIDEPINIARARLASAVIAAIKRNESRVTTLSVSFKEELDAGRLVPVVHLDLIGEGGESWHSLIYRQSNT